MSREGALSWTTFGSGIGVTELLGKTPFTAFGVAEGTGVAVAGWALSEAEAVEGDPPGLDLLQPAIRSAAAASAPTARIQ